jgi:hypothetical protein
MRIGYCVRVEQLLVYGEDFKAFFSVNKGGRLALATDNVRRLTLWPPFAGASLAIDGQSLGELPASARSASCVRTEDGWSLAAPPGAREKRAGYGGPVFNAFENRFVMVYGTAGTDEENRELLERARADQQRWWALARGLPPLLSDVDMDKPAWLDRVSGCNVILYGSATTNGAWNRLVGDGPLRVERGAAVVGDERFERDDLCALFVRPRADAPGRALVAVFAETGPAGARLGYAVNPFDPATPDYLVLSPDFLTPSRDGDGVLAEGWFDHAWEIQRSK